MLILVSGPTQGGKTYFIDKMYFPKKENYFGPWKSSPPLTGDLLDLLYEEEFKEFLPCTDYDKNSYTFNKVVSILAALLGRPDNETFVIEHPESGIDQKTQLMVGEMIVRLSHNNTVVLETNSEAILLRVRTSIASGKLSSDKVHGFVVSDRNPKRFDFAPNGDFLNNPNFDHFLDDFDELRKLRRLQQK